MSSKQNGIKKNKFTKQNLLIYRLQSNVFDQHRTIIFIFAVETIIKTITLRRQASKFMYISYDSKEAKMLYSIYLLRQRITHRFRSKFGLLKFFQVIVA